MRDSREPSALTFIGAPVTPSPVTFIPNLTQPVDIFGCGLSGGCDPIRPTNIMWDDNESILWDDGDAVDEED